MPGPRILLLLPQMPQDPSSGATRTVQTAAEMAQEAGFEVRALATTATELGARSDPLALLNSACIQPEVHAASPRSFREIRFGQRGIYYTLLDTGRFPVGGWEKTHGRQFDLLLENDRGGLAESANGAGFTIPLPGDYTWETRKAVSPDAVKPWVDTKCLAFDEPLHQAEVVKARAAGEMNRRRNTK